MTMTESQLAVARATKGFMPEDEGLALHDGGAGRRPGRAVARDRLVLREVRGLPRVARRPSAGTVLFTIDHHHGSEENQAGWEHHDTEVVDPRTGRMDTLPFFRRTIEDAGLEGAVVAIVGDSPTVGRFWLTPVGLLFIDGGHAEDVAMADYDGWARFVAPGGVLAIHDVFERPDDGGQAPFRVWQRAVAEGFTPVATTGSLRTLRR